MRISPGHTPWAQADGFAKEIYRLKGGANPARQTTKSKELCCLLQCSEPAPEMAKVPVPELQCARKMQMAKVP